MLKRNRGPEGARFKIDTAGGKYYLYALYYWKETMGFGRWQRVETFSELEQAKEFYEKIKGLPIYCQ